MIYRYQIDVKTKEGSTKRTIKKSIFRKKELTDTFQNISCLRLIVIFSSFIGL